MRKYLIGLAAVLFPALSLFSTGQGFYRDWHNHVWMVGYFGEYVRQHGWFPYVVNTTEVGGLAFPAFYGYLFYPLLGLFSTHLHPEIVVRLASLLLFAAQYVCVRKTVRRLKASEELAASFACATIWCVYGLTNLYNRSALTEFFAVGLLTCAVCSWFDLLQAATAGAVWRRGLRFGLMLTLSMGFHPITGLFSLPLLGVLLLALPARRAPLRQLLAVWCVTGAAAVLVLSPWLYAVRKFEKDLSIAALSAEIADLTEHIDHWQTRLHPLPSDSRCLEFAPAEVSTPFLDSQISFPLLILSAALAVVILRRLEGRARWLAAGLAGAPALYAAASLYLSLRIDAFDYLPRVFVKVQFLYRLVSYVNLGFLLVPLFLLAWAKRRAPAAAPVSVSPVLLCFVLTYAGFCVALKLQHAEAARIPEKRLVQYWAERGRPYDPSSVRQLLKDNADRERLTALPLSSCIQRDYLAPHYLAPLPADEQAGAPFAPLGVQRHGKHFGENGVATVTVGQPCYVGTEVLVFPWNRFEVDGVPVPPEALRSWCDARVEPYPLPRTAVPVAAGTHTIRCRFVPSPKWLWLHRTGWAALFAWLFAVGATSIAPLVRRKHVAVAPAVMQAALPTPRLPLPEVAAAKSESPTT